MHIQPHSYLYASGEDLLVTTEEGTLYSVENMQRMDFRYKQGLIAGIFYDPNPEHTVGLVFKGLLEWNQIRKATSPGNQLVVPTYPIVTNDWVDTTFIEIDYHAKFNSAELVYWNHDTPRYVDYFSFAWLFGIPGIKLTDRMTYHNTKEFFLGTFHDTYMISISNDMIGAETGFDFENNPTCYFTWALQGKVAGYANMLKKTVTLNDQNSTAALVDTQINKVRPAYSLDFNTYILFRSRLGALRLGYNYFNLYGAAISPNQVRRSDSLYEIQISKKRIGFNSFYVGLSFDW